MKIKFSKYHALGNDFIVLDRRKTEISTRRLSRLASMMCDRHTGVGADGLACLSSSDKADCKVDIYNADGGWAEKSGNGLRIAAVYLNGRRKKARQVKIETGTSVDTVNLTREIAGGHIVRTELGQPEFETSRIPVRTRRRFVINSPLKVGSVELPMTCVAIGNPHVVLLVDSFDFDWPALGAEIENARPFPNGANVEFVRADTSKRIELAEWERGVGATDSCGTGAAAAVATLVMMGLADRKCEVVFKAGSLKVDWKADTDIIEISGAVRYVMQGTYDFR
ncbi:MAG: diaminopimelate epimerase [bacterium]|nr:diaminopimelate epimerase [bacterium]